MDHNKDLTPQATASQILITAFQVNEMRADIESMKKEIASLREDLSKANSKASKLEMAIETLRDEALSSIKSIYYWVRKLLEWHGKEAEAGLKD